ASTSQKQSSASPQLERHVEEVWESSRREELAGTGTPQKRPTGDVLKSTVYPTDPSADSVQSRSPRPISQPAIPPSAGAMESANHIRWTLEPLDHPEDVDALALSTIELLDYTESLQCEVRAIRATLHAS